MIRSITTVLEGERVSAIKVAEADAQLPSYLLSGEKKPGYRFDGEALHPWYWKNFAVIDGDRYLVFDELPLFPFAEIATTRRDEGLFWVRLLAQALAGLDSAFLDLSTGVLPLWRVWGIETGGLLILSQDVADLFSATAEEDQRYFNAAAWVHHSIHPPFTLIDQLTSLLYYSAAGFPPFLERACREDGFRPLKLNTMETGLDHHTIAFIDRTLTMSMNGMREASGNKRPQVALSYFLNETENLTWNLARRTETVKRDELRAIEACRTFLDAQQKRASRKIFWRTKGWIVILTATVVILVSAFVGSRIKESLAPPYTAAMNQQEIIHSYYLAQNDLDLQAMEAALARKVKNPSAMEVANLFVTRQTRQAYESIKVQIDPNDWIAEGQAAIPADTFIYGITDVNIEQIGANTYIARGLYWTPFNYNDEEIRQSDSMPVFSYPFEQHFVIEMGKRGWFEITSLTAPSFGAVKRIDVPTYQRAPNNALQL